MTNPDGVATEAENDDVSPSWGTWEELILAFAVNRYGTASWDSISSELQKRTSDPNLSLTARNCRLKYLDLKRRYVADDPDGGESSVDDSAAPLLGELRKLRVAELRQEVQRYDLSIESLELKVKSMEEEREKKSRREKEDSDPEIRGVDEKRGDEPASGGDRVLGEESEKDQLSMNESNSTDPDAEKLGSGERETEPGGTGADEVSPDRTGKTSEEPAEINPEPDRKSAREDSCNGSSNSIEKNEPEAVSCGGEEAAKGNSDVQSSASRSRKEEGSDNVRRGNTSGDEDQSQPLLDFLQAIRAHKLGSTFERRLRSQQTSVYQKLILQHMDLETVETRLRQGWYSGPSPGTKFFRDLLLLANNALVFFPRKSVESHAANEIRTLVSKEITHKKARSDSSSVKQASVKSLTMSKKPEETDELSNPLMLKPRIPGSLIVCRKRSSIAAKASSSDKKKEPQQKTPLLATEEKEPKKSPSESEEPKITKKRTRDNRIPSTSPAPLANIITKKNNVKNNNQASNNNPKRQGGKRGGGSSSENAKGDINKKSQSDSKKRGAANFLNRMKQGSPSSNNNGALLDALKSTPLVTNEVGKRGGGSPELKKNENVKRGGKDQVTRKSAAEMTRQTKEKEKEKGSPGKRNVGRPPKREAAAAVVVPPPAAGKRGRERGETETPPGKQQPKKRLRKV